MTLYITEVVYGWFKKSFSELTIIEKWNSDVVPVKDDIIHLKGQRYLVLQRDLFSSTVIKLYVREL